MGLFRKPAAIETAPRSGLLQTRDLAQIVDGIISEGSVLPQDIRALPAVAGARRLIASTIDQIPLKVKIGEDVQETPAWLRRPRAYGGQLDQGDLIQHCIDSMILHGRADISATCVGEGDSPSWRLDALDPNFVQVLQRTDGIVGISTLVAGREMPPVPPVLSRVKKGSTYVLHIPYIVTAAHPEGTTPLTEAASVLRGFVQTERHAATLFDGGTTTGGVLTTAHDITVTQAKEWQAFWIEARQEKKVPVMGNGLEYRNEVPNAVDLQMVEARSFNQSVIWALLGIPLAYMGSSLMGGQTSLSYSNALDNRRQFGDACLRAFTQQMGDAFSTLLPAGRNEAESTEAFFDYSEWEGRADGKDDVAADPESTVQ